MIIIAIIEQIYEEHKTKINQKLMSRLHKKGDFRIGPKQTHRDSLNRKRSGNEFRWWEDARGKVIKQ